MTIDSLKCAGAILSAFVSGIVLGVALALLIYERAQARVARWQRTGQVDAPPKTTTTAVPGGEFAGVSVEAEAQQRAYAKVIERGAEQMMELEPGLTIEEARAKARRALEELGAFRSGVGGM